VEALSRVARSGPSRPIIAQQHQNRPGIPWRVSPAGDRSIDVIDSFTLPPILAIEAWTAAIFMLLCGERCTIFCCVGW